MGIDPVSLAIASGVISSGFGAYGSIQKGNADAAQADSQAKALQMQAAAEERRGNQERAIAQRNAEDEMIKTDKLRGRQRAVAAASGGGTDGSAAEIEAETAREGALNSELELWKGEESARGREDQAALYVAEAKNTQRQGKQARKAGFVNAGSAVLGAVLDGAALRVKNSSPGSGSGKGVYYR